MNTVESVRRLLSHTVAEPVCDDCLAFACATGLNEMRAVTEALVESARAFHRGSSCATCRRAAPTIFYRRAGGGREAAAS